MLEAPRSVQCAHSQLLPRDWSRSACWRAAALIAHNPTRPSRPEPTPTRFTRVPCRTLLSSCMKVSTTHSAPLAIKGHPMGGFSLCCAPPTLLTGSAWAALYNLHRRIGDINIGRRKLPSTMDGFISIIPWAGWNPRSSNCVWPQASHRKVLIRMLSTSSRIAIKTDLQSTPFPFGTRTGSGTFFTPATSQMRRPAFIPAPR